VAGLTGQTGRQHYEQKGIVRESRKKRGWLLATKHQPIRGSNCNRWALDGGAGDITVLEEDSSVIAEESSREKRAGPRPGKKRRFQGFLSRNAAHSLNKQSVHSGLGGKK